MNLFRTVFKSVFAFIIVFSSCQKLENTDKESYRWTTKGAFPLIPAFYLDESYFLLTGDLPDRMISLTRMDEKYGDTIYTVSLGEASVMPSRFTSEMWSDKDEVYIVTGKSFFVVDKETGEILRKYTYDKHFWRVNIEDGYIYTCFYIANDKFGYAKINISNGVMTTLHTEQLERYHDFIGGHAPIVAGEALVYPFYRGNFSEGEYENYIIWSLPEKDSLIRLDWYENSLGGPVFQDESTIYLFMMDQMLAYRKSDLSLKWKAETIESASGPFQQTDDKIYMIPSREIETEEGNNNVIYIFNKSNGHTTTVSSPACLAQVERIGYHLYFVGWGDFKKFNIVTEQFDFISSLEDSPHSAYQPYFGISPNTKILWDDLGWHCFPL